MGREDKKNDKLRSESALQSIAIMIAIGCAGIFLFAGQSKSFGQYCSVAGVGIMIAGAALLAGGLLGFLFGIPRTLQQEHTGEGNRAGQEDEKNETRSLTYQVNTNLEQISDWLTKILVGVGLTQISAVPGLWKDYSGYLSEGLGRFASSRLFGGAELVYFLVCGFLISYLWTRLYLAGAFRQADLSSLGILTDKVTEVKNQLTAWQEQNLKDASALNIVQRQLSPDISPNPVKEEDLVESIKNASQPAKAQIFYIAQKARKDNWRDQKEKMEYTIPIFKALIADDTKNEYHANHGQLGYALKDKRTPDWNGAETELTKAIQIRGDWRLKGWMMYELNLAICQIQLDPDFQLGKPSQAASKQKILENLSIACCDSYVADVAKTEPTVEKWRKLNKVRSIPLIS